MLEAVELTGAVVLEVIELTGAMVIEVVELTAAVLDVEGFEETEEEDATVVDLELEVVLIGATVELDSIAEEVEAMLLLLLLLDETGVEPFKAPHSPVSAVSLKLSE